MAEIKKGTEHSRIENVGEALTKAELFIEKNQKILTYIIIVVAALVLGFWYYRTQYLAPKNIEAHTQMYVAEQYFQKDSFNLALNGDGNNWGFLKIIDEYGMTKAANLAHYYAGISYYKLGRFNRAIEELEKFKGNDKFIAPEALGTIGDSYWAIGNKDKALKYFLNAAKKNANEFTSPIYLMKAGILCEAKGDFKQALKIYQEIQDKYPQTNEGHESEKYITRMQILLTNKN